MGPRLASKEFPGCLCSIPYPPISVTKQHFPTCNRLASHPFGAMCRAIGNVIKACTKSSAMSCKVHPECMRISQSATQPFS